MKTIKKLTLTLLVFLVALSLIELSGNRFHSPGEAQAKITLETVDLDEKNPEIRATMGVQNRHAHELMAIEKVVGTATGLNEAGRPAVLVFTKETVRQGHVPESVEGVPVVVNVTGEFSAMSNTGIFAPPVPVGVSTGNIGECSAGTIGARVKGSGNVYALSNNHVYALENTAHIGSQILQPGLYDTRCGFRNNNVIGTLYQFVPISFTSGTNTVDAAIALTSTGLLGNATPSGGYGVPNSVTAAAVLGQAVQKYGRTSSLTKGTVTGINATVSVNYGPSGTATFVNQIIVSSSRPFIKAGDSGSLLVTNDSNAKPVGLLFAGSSTGKLAVANRINDVLSSFGVSIDGK